MDDDEEEEDDEDKDKNEDEKEGESSDSDEERMIKNPDVDTSFLPDRVREEEENKLREEFRQVRRRCSRR